MVIFELAFPVELLLIRQANKRGIGQLLSPIPNRSNRPVEADLVRVLDKFGIRRNVSVSWDPQKMV